MDNSTIRIATLVIMLILVILSITEKNITDLIKRVKRVKLVIMLALLIALLDATIDNTFGTAIWMVCSFFWIFKLRLLEKILNETTKDKPNSDI